MSGALEALAAELGLVWHYWDGAGREATAPPETLRAVSAALGHDAETDEAAAQSLAALRAAQGELPQWVLVAQGQEAHLPGTPAPWELRLEDGTRLTGAPCEAITLPPLPMGYHWLETGGARVAVLCAPERLDPPARSWGVMAPLYGLRPVGQGGIGDYTDLALAGQALGDAGAGFLGINPVHAGFAEDHSNFSPYAPASRERFATMHIAVRGPALPADGALIDYQTALPATYAALDAAFAAFEATGGSPDFDAWRAQEGAALELFALHQALSEVHGAYWAEWPEAYQSPDTIATRSFAQAHPDRLRAHAWRQWMAERQLAAAQAAAKAAGMRHGLYLDLAVGTHPGGAETWADPALFARNVSLGAPPDGFAPEAQVWNLAPPLPNVMAERGFAPLACTLRKQLKYSGLLRIDHILGFERAFWVPDGLPGVYVTMPKAALLAVARIEAARAGAVIVGEDLGVVSDGLRHDLAAAGIFGCRVAMFERHWHGDRSFVAPEHYPQQVMASFGSHDLPLWAGWRAGRDIDWREKLGNITAEEAAHQRQTRAGDVACFDARLNDHSGDATAMFRYLAATAARLAAVQLEDMLGMREQPNLPGTIHEHPNWRRRLSCGGAALGDVKLVQQTAAIMAAHDR